MAWREVSVSYGKWTSGVYHNSLSDLHSREDRREILQSLVRWERGEINPWGGIRRTGFTFQSRPTQEELSAYLDAIASVWLDWESTPHAQPVLLIERDGTTPTGKRVEYDIIGERTWHNQGELRVRLPVREDHLLLSNGHAYRRMDVNRLRDRYAALSPILTEAVESFGFPITRHEPTTEKEVAVVCISPMQISSIPVLKEIVQEAAELGCQISVTLRSAMFEKFHHAKMLLKQREGEWFFTFIVEGGSLGWRSRMISSFESFGSPIPAEATLNFLESYEAPPKEPWLRLPQIKLPDNKLGRAVGLIVGSALVPVVLIGVGIGGGINLLKRGLSAVAKTVSTPTAKRWRRVVTEPRERRRKEERERKWALTDLFEALHVPAQKDRVETCFLAVSEDVNKNPKAALARLQTGRQEPSSDAEGGA